MEYIIFGAKIVILLLLCFILLRSLQYFILQVGFYYKSRHLAAFLDKKKVTAEEYLFRNEKLWRRNFRNAPYLRGGGSRAFIRELLYQARAEIAIKNFKNNHELSLYCFSCYFNPKCAKKYMLTCKDCALKDCERKADGHVHVCQRFQCRNRIENNWDGQERN